MKAMVIVAVNSVDVSIGVSHSLLYNNYTFGSWQSFSEQIVYKAPDHQYILVSNLSLDL